MRSVSIIKLTKLFYKNEVSINLDPNINIHILILILAEAILKTQTNYKPTFELQNSFDLKTKYKEINKNEDNV